MKWVAVAVLILLPYITYKVYQRVPTFCLTVIDGLYGQVNVEFTGGKQKQTPKLSVVFQLQQY